MPLGLGAGWHGCTCGGGLEFFHVKLGADHLLEHEVVIQVEDGAGFGGDHRVAAQGELVILLLLADKDQLVEPLTV
jgi:hypothetical protein